MGSGKLGSDLDLKLRSAYLPPSTFERPDSRPLLYIINARWAECDGVFTHIVIGGWSPPLPACRTLVRRPRVATCADTLHIVAVNVDRAIRPQDMRAPNDPDRAMASPPVLWLCRCLKTRPVRSPLRLLDIRMTGWYWAAEKCDVYGRNNT